MLIGCNIVMRGEPRARVAILALVLSLCACKKKGNAGPTPEQLAEEANQVAARCKQIETSLGQGNISDADLDWMGTGQALRSGETLRQLLRRIASKAMTSDDLKWEKDHFHYAGPLRCNDIVWPALVRANAASETPWSDPSNLSDDMRQAVLAEGLSPASLSALAKAADAAAKAVASKKTTDDLAGAKRQCDLVSQAKGVQGAICVSLEKNYRRIEEQEQAQAKAKAARCQEVENARNKCFDRCLDFDVNDPRNEQCEQRCDGRFPKSGCD